MMDFLTAHAPSSRRSFSVRQLVRSHFGHFQGDAPAYSHEACVGRPGDEYITCYPMKKCRSHTSMAQTTDSNLDTEDCGYVVTSAPENAFCVTDTDGDSGCCGKDAAADAGYCCQPAAPLRLRHSTSSSTALSSHSGTSSPSLPVRLATSGAKAFRAEGLARGLQVAVAAAVEEEDGGSGLMGAFGIFTSDQWASLQSAVNSGASNPTPAAPPKACASRPQSSANVLTAALPSPAPPAAAAAPPEAPAATGPEAQNPESPAAAPGTSPGGGFGCGLLPPQLGSNSPEPADRPSPGGSTGSMASLWAAVNQASSAAAYESTDDNAQAGHGRGWANAGRPRVPAPCLIAPPPVISTSPAGHDRFAAHHDHHHPYDYPQPDGPGQQTPPPRLPAEPYLTFRHTHHVTHAADSPGSEAPDSPSSLALRAASCTSNSSLAQARNHLLAGYYSHQPDRPIPESYDRSDEVSRPPSRKSVDSGQQQQQHHHHHHQQEHCSATSQPPQPPQPAHAPHRNTQPLPQPPQPSSPSYRRTSTLVLPPQPTSYTTYGYRRARSSLAALEQGGSCPHAAIGAVAVGSGSSSDDEDDYTEEATRRMTAAFRTHTGMASRNNGWGLLGVDSAPSTPTCEAARREYWTSGAQSSGLSCGANGGGDGGEGGGGNGGQDPGDADGDTGGPLTRKRSSYHLTNSHAAVELFLRLNHARQTMDFVKRQTQLFACLDKAQMTVWEALQTMDELREYEAVLMADTGDAQDVAALSLLDHAFQTAELCRLHHPEHDWLHLVGLIHGLGKLLAHRRLGTQPQWAICGETFPLGCRFSPHILGSQYFTANPDRRRRLYNTPTGLYDPGCGLLNVVMSWSAPEYLYLVLMLNSAPLPQDALWILRHAKFLTLTRPHSCYQPLCSADDQRRLALLRSFQGLAAYRRTELPEGFALRGEERTAYYSALIAKYIGEGKLLW